MSTVTRTLRRLSQVDVSHVSLVDRGANRIPFRIVKRDAQPQENLMINLRNLLKAEKPAAPAPTAVVLKGEDFTDEVITGIQASLKELGMDFTVVTKADGNTVLSESADFSTGTDAVELSADTAVILKSFAPYSTELKDLSFAEAASARGFYNSVHSATDVFKETVYSRMYDAKSPAEAAAEVKKLAQEFVSYVSTMAAGLPSKVFKMEEIVKSATGKKKPATEEKGDGNGSCDDETKEGKKPMMKSEEPEAPTSETAQEEAPVAVTTGTEPAEAPVAEIEKTDPPAKAEPTPQATAPSADLEAVLKAVGALTAQVGELATVVKASQESVAKLESAQTLLKSEVDTATRKAEDATRVLKGTVVGSDTGGETTLPAPVKKSEDPRSGCFDTAYIRR